VLGVTALLLIGQALARQMFLDSVDHASLRALGASRGQLALTSMLRAVVVAAGGAVLAVVVAILASPLMPIGPARVAEPDPGFSVDGLVLAGGGLLLFACVVLVALVPAWWFSRPATFTRVDEMPGRPSRIAAWVRAGGASLPATSGVRMALEPGRGSTAVPVRTTIVGASIALATVIGALTFAASLDHLVSTPRLFGWDWDVLVDISVDTAAQVDAREEILADLRSDDEVAGYVDTALSRLLVDGVAVTTLGIGESRGGVGPTVVSGRLPGNDREIALGAKTMERLGASVGDTVTVSAPDGDPVRLRVVGRVVLPGLGNYPGSDKTALGEGAVATLAAVRDLGPDFGGGPVFVRFREGADRARFSRALDQREASAFSVRLASVQRPSDIVSYERVRSTPFVLAGLLAVFAIAIVSHALVTVVRRRRRDLALLKTLGFTRRQVSASVAWQATTVGLAAVVIGIPVGIVLGRWAWTTLADDLGTVAEPLVPVGLVVLVVPVVLLLLNGVAYVPGRMAARLRPAAALRSE
jgi:ABC-type lipoprotein release transport system permease subunit